MYDNDTNEANAINKIFLERLLNRINPEEQAALNAYLSDDDPSEYLSWKYKTIIHKLATIAGATRHCRVCNRTTSMEEFGFNSEDRCRKCEPAHTRNYRTLIVRWIAAMEKGEPIRCNHCGHDKAPVDFNHKSLSRCRECTNAANRITPEVQAQYRAARIEAWENAVADGEMLECKACGQTKPLSAYGKFNRSRCKVCQRAKDSAQRKEQGRQRAMDRELAVISGELWTCKDCTEQKPAGQFDPRDRKRCQPCSTAYRSEGSRKAAEKLRAKRVYTNPRPELRPLKSAAELWNEALATDGFWPCEHCGGVGRAREFSNGRRSRCRTCKPAPKPPREKKPRQPREPKPPRERNPREPKPPREKNPPRPPRETYEEAVANGSLWRCYVCEEHKPAGEFYKGSRSRCKVCESNYKKEKWKKNPRKPMSTETYEQAITNGELWRCHVCQEHKPASDFYKSNPSRCKACDISRIAARRKKLRESHAA